MIEVIKFIIYFGAGVIFGWFILALICANDNNDDRKEKEK